MDFINLLSSAWPQNNFWANLIKIFDFGSYAWAIILFTVILKLVLAPLDLTQRYFTTKTSRAQARLAPQLEKLKRQYGQNQNLLAQKQNELYKKEGFGMGSSCIFMLVYMVVTMVVFLTLFNSLRNVATFKIKNQYNELQKEYAISFNTNYMPYLGVDAENVALTIVYSSASVVVGEKTFETLEQEKIASIKAAEGLNDDEAAAVLNQQKSEYVATAQNLVVEKYKQIKDSWLWVKNVWRADKATDNSILDYKSYVASTSDDVGEGVYNTVMGKLLGEESGENGPNGFYVLSVLVLMVSLLSQYISRRSTAPKDRNGKPVSQPGAGKVMMLLLPAIMVVFTLSSNTIFSVYILTNSIVSTLLVPATTAISNVIITKQEKKKQNLVKVDYRR